MFKFAEYLQTFPESYLYDIEILNFFTCDYTINSMYYKFDFAGF